MELTIKGKTYKLPIFMPDATHASIKAVDSISLAQTGLQGLVTNTFHLINDQVVDVIEKSGGIKKFMNFDGLIITDSGGFQAMSLVRRNAINGKHTEDGVIFKNSKSGSKVYLTPESCIETQIKLGSDIIMTLDDCTEPGESHKEQLLSVKRTISWAQRCKKAYLELTKDTPQKNRPLIFAIIQGGNDKELREKCAKALMEIGFDGYAYGGWPLDKNGLLREILEYTANLIPDRYPKYAMGVGKPQDIIDCYKLGYNMFDCVIPTRDARHARLYINSDNGAGVLNLSNEKYREDFSPIDQNCECYTCKNFTKSYLRHLYKVGEPVFSTLASIHNIYYFDKLTKSLNKEETPSK